MAQTVCEGQQTLSYYSEYEWTRGIYNMNLEAV
jgi:hypothetical protein